MIVEAGGGTPSLLFGLAGAVIGVAAAIGAQWVSGNIVDVREKRDRAAGNHACGRPSWAISWRYVQS
jgi:hypothetical protein